MYYIDLNLSYNEIRVKKPLLNNSESTLQKTQDYKVKLLTETPQSVSLQKLGETKAHINIPVDLPGANGAGVKVPEHLSKLEQELFKENEFNVVASDLIALNRSVPDYRNFKQAKFCSFYHQYYLKIL